MCLFRTVDVTSSEAPQNPRQGFLGVDRAVILQHSKVCMIFTVRSVEGISLSMDTPTM